MRLHVSLEGRTGSWTQPSSIRAKVSALGSFVGPARIHSGLMTCHAVWPLDMAMDFSCFFTLSKEEMKKERNPTSAL
jgi:hypothetical protein